MATTSWTPVGHSADSPALILRPSPATGHDADIRVGDDPSLCYAAIPVPPVEVLLRQGGEQTGLWSATR
jgi:hypothetical protein